MREQKRNRLNKSRESLINAHHKEKQYVHYESPSKRKMRERTRKFTQIMAKNFPSLKKETYIQIQDVQGLPKRMNPNNSIGQDAL